MDNINNKLLYNLQFFAKDGPGGEKTEPATTKKLSDARKDGQVAKSKEIVNGIALIGSFAILKFWIGKLGSQFIDVFTRCYSLIKDVASGTSDEINYNTIVTIVNEMLIQLIIMVLPLFAVAFVVNFVGDLVQVKWKPTLKPLQPKFSKINPGKGIKNIFSMKTVVNLLKSVGTIIILTVICYFRIKSKVGVFLSLYEFSLMRAIAVIGDMALDLGMVLSASYLVIGFIDLLYEKKKFSDEMKMTKQEVKEEFKNTEGDPQIKSRIKSKMREASQRRMMQNLPKADVVITNPTHFAVALQYDTSQSKAPVVIAKGEDYLAQKIKEVAREHQIEIVENKPLARMIYHNVDIGSEIPEELYQAVAEVLAFVYNIKKNK